MEWISVKDRLPNEHEKVLVLFGGDNILIGIMDSNNEWFVFYSDGRNIEDFERPISHWMPLPEPPHKPKSL
jgi:hypothetical protein